MLEKRGNAAHEKTGKACNVDPKDAVLHSIKQDLKAEEVGDSINSELAIFGTDQFVYKTCGRSLVA